VSEERAASVFKVQGKKKKLMKTDGVRSSDTLVAIYQIPQRHILEGGKFCAIIFLNQCGHWIFQST
jgi:hypothetical protein